MAVRFHKDCHNIKIGELNMAQSDLDKVLSKLDDEYKDLILKGARNYIEVNIGEAAEKYGYANLKGRYNDVFAIVPLKHHADGMKVRIDGRTFINYAQVKSGIAVPGYISKDLSMPYKRFVPNDSMILNS